jgi:hypothetical protein
VEDIEMVDVYAEIHCQLKHLVIVQMVVYSVDQHLQMVPFVLEDVE